MNRRIFVFIVSLVLILNTLLCKNSYAEEKNNCIKVGVFSLEPYAYLNSKGEIDGYYIKLFNLIAKKMNIEVEYVLSDIKDWIWNIDNDYVDIILGAALIEERVEKFSFNKYSIAIEHFALYTNTDIKSINVEQLNNLRFGYIKESKKSEWIFNFFNSLRIEVIPVVGRNYSELEELMDNNKIDLMIDSAYSNNKYRKIYQFLGDKTYISTKKEKQDLLDQIDEAIAYYYKEEEDVIPNLYNSYFDKEENEINNRIRIWIISSIIIFMIIFVIFIIPRIRRKSIRKKINIRLENERYLLHYQPIYDPIKEKVVGFEGLLRLNDKNNNFISPAKFIPEIEKNDMLFDVTLWIISKVILDYEEIKNYNCINNNDFYISINLSVDEIQNNKFVDKAIELLKKSKLKDKSICLEIVERVGIKDLYKISNNIEKLKNAGFKIAIDDFGSKYSNLDVLEKLDADIIKIDKEFVDGLGKHLVKNETILFIIRVAEKENKYVVLEGVEDKEQDSIIKSFNSENIFVQGYFYNKPMEIQKLKDL